MRLSWQEVVGFVIAVLIAFLGLAGVGWWVLMHPVRWRKGWGEVPPPPRKGMPGAPKVRMTRELEAGYRDAMRSAAQDAKTQEYLIGMQATPQVELERRDREAWRREWEAMHSRTQDPLGPRYTLRTPEPTAARIPRILVPGRRP